MTITTTGGITIEFNSLLTEVTHETLLRSRALRNVPGMHAVQHCTQGGRLLLCRVPR